MNKTKEQEDQMLLIKILEYPELYKKNSTIYKQSLFSGDKNIMILVTNVLSKILSSPNDYIPMIQLNGLRLIKETIQETSSSEYYLKLI